MNKQEYNKLLGTGKIKRIVWGYKCKNCGYEKTHKIDECVHVSTERIVPCPKCGEIMYNIMSHPHMTLDEEEFRLCDICTGKIGESIKKKKELARFAGVSEAALRKNIGN